MTSRMKYDLCKNHCITTWNSILGGEETLVAELWGYVFVPAGEVWFCWTGSFLHKVMLKRPM
jgi:hypothetical protein